jgi:hypothetical protein
MAGGKREQELKVKSSHVKYFKVSSDRKKAAQGRPLDW